MTYQPQESKLSAFHPFNLRSILGNTWKDKMTNEEVFRITGSSHFLARLKFIRLLWAGHVNRISLHGIPKLLLHSVLEKRTRLRRKNVKKKYLKDLNIELVARISLSEYCRLVTSIILVQTWRNYNKEGRSANDV